MTNDTLRIRAPRCHTPELGLDVSNALQSSPASSVLEWNIGPIAHHVFERQRDARSAGTLATGRGCLLCTWSLTAYIDAHTSATSEAPRALCHIHLLPLSLDRLVAGSDRHGVCNRPRLHELPALRTCCGYSFGCHLCKAYFPLYGISAPELSLTRLPCRMYIAL